MMRQFESTLTIATPGRGFHELTDSLRQFAAHSRVQTGLLTVHVMHTSASLLIQENADPEVRRDLERFFSRLVQDGDRLFRHTAEGDDDMPAHIRCALTAVNLSIPISAGRMSLGTWQGVFLWEHRTHPHSRQVHLHLIGE